MKENTPKKADDQDAPDNHEAPRDEKHGYKDLNLPEPTRYGDWEVKGRCSDF